VVIMVVSGGSGDKIFMSNRILWLYYLVLRQPRVVLV